MSADTMWVGRAFYRFASDDAERGVGLSDHLDPITAAGIAQYDRDGLRAQVLARYGTDEQESTAPEQSGADEGRANMGSDIASAVERLKGNAHYQARVAELAKLKAAVGTDLKVEGSDGITRTHRITPEYVAEMERHVEAYGRRLTSDYVREAEQTRVAAERKAERDALRAEAERRVDEMAAEQRIEREVRTVMQERGLAPREYPSTGESAERTLIDRSGSAAAA